MSAPRKQRDVPRECDYCKQRPVFAVQHVGYADHIGPGFACKRHLAHAVLEAEYGEGDEMYVRRIRFDV